VRSAKRIVRNHERHPRARTPRGARLFAKTHCCPWGKSSHRDPLTTAF